MPEIAISGLTRGSYVILRIVALVHLERDIDPKLRIEAVNRARSASRHLSVVKLERALHDCTGRRVNFDASRQRKVITIGTTNEHRVTVF